MSGRGVAVLVAFAVAVALPVMAQSFAPITASKTHNEGFGEVIRITPKVAKVDIRSITVDRGRCAAMSAALMGTEGVLATKPPFELGTNRWVKVDIFGVGCPGHEVTVETASGRWDFRLD